MQTEINKTHYLWIFFIKIQKKDQKKFLPPKNLSKKQTPSFNEFWLKNA